MYGTAEDPVDREWRNLDTARREMRTAMKKYLDCAESWGSVAEDVVDELTETIKKSETKYSDDVTVIEREV